MSIVGVGWVVVKRSRCCVDRRDERDSVPPVSAWGLDRLEFFEVEVVDGLQRLGSSPLLKAVGQGLEPGPIFRLESDQGGDSVAPALGPASAVGGSTVMDHRPGGSAGGAMPGLALGIGHRLVAGGCAGHEIHSKGSERGALRNGIQWL